MVRELDLHPFEFSGVMPCSVLTLWLPVRAASDQIIPVDADLQDLEVPNCLEKMKNPENNLWMKDFGQKQVYLYIYIYNDRICPRCGGGCAPPRCKGSKYRRHDWTLDPHGIGSNASQRVGKSTDPVLLLGIQSYLLRR